MSINKIHVNNSTKMSLNDRFTAIQSNIPKITNNTYKRINPRSKNIMDKEENGGGRIPKASFANRKFLERLERKHKIQAAMKLKRKSLKANLPARQRIQNRIGLKKKGISKAIRVTTAGKLIRSNSLSHIATMKADLVAPVLKRSNSTSSIASRLGNQNNGTPQRRRQLKRSTSKQRLSRSRSRSQSNLRRFNSKSNLRRMPSNNKRDLSRGRREAPRSLQKSKRINQNQNQNRNNRSVSRQRRQTNPVINNNNNNTGRFNQRNLNIPRRRLSQNNNNVTRRGSNGGASQEFVPFKRRNSMTGTKQGRISRPTRRDNSIQRRGRSRSRNRTGNRVVRGRGQTNTAPAANRRGGNQLRGRKGLNRVQGGRGAPKTEIKREDLDKELDQYMANTKTALDKEMDVFMGGNTM